VCIYKKKTDVNNIHILEAACVVHVRFNEPFTEWILKRTRYIKTTKFLPVSNGLPTALMTICSFYYLFFSRSTEYKKSPRWTSCEWVLLLSSMRLLVKWYSLIGCPVYLTTSGSVKRENAYTRLIKLIKHNMFIRVAVHCIHYYVPIRWKRIREDRWAQ